MGVVYARDSSAARARARRATHARFAEFGVYIGAMTQFGLSSAGMLENELCPARNTSAVDQWAMCRSAASVVRAGCFAGPPRPSTSMWTETPRRRKTSKSADVQKRRSPCTVRYRRSSAMVDVKMWTSTASAGATDRARAASV